MTLNHLRSKMDIFVKGEPGYQEAREPSFNSLLTAEADLVVRPATTEDVQLIIQYANQENKKVTVSSGGGHSFFCQQKDSICIDLRKMKKIQIDPENKTVTTGPGCKLGEVDQATAEFGFHVPMGVVSHTGLGLVLGGGVGWLCRLHGLAADNLLSATVVTGDGRIVHTSSDENPDLLLSMKGGAGLTGVVTEMKLQGFVHSEVFHVVLAFSFSILRQLLDAFVEYVNDPENEKERRATAYLLIGYGPDGNKAVMFLGSFIGGTAEQTEHQFQKFFALPHHPLVKKQMSILELQRSSDLQFPKRHWYQTAVHVINPNQDFRDTCVDILYSNQIQFFGGVALEQRGGRYAELHGNTNTLVRERDAKLDLIIFTGWDDASESENRIPCYRRWKTRLVSTGQRATDLVNMSSSVDGVELDNVVLSSGDTLPATSSRAHSLLWLKKKYDPQNVLLSGFKIGGVLPK